MNQRRGWNIHTRTQLISVGPALLLTLLLTGFLTFTRLQDLRLEQGHIGQLIANQLAPERLELLFTLGSDHTDSF